VCEGRGFCGHFVLFLLAIAIDLFWKVNYSLRLNL
jgi:hypothetical protein